MKKLILITFIFGNSIVLAETIRDRVHSVSDGLIRFENGRVAFITDEKNIDEDALIEVEIDNESRLLDFKEISPPRLNQKALSFLQETSRPSFEPSIVPSMAEMQKIFDRSNSYYKRVSECTDRAHVWAHDEFKQSGIKSKKVFVFFTASYINSVRFKWWFHVAPLYSVKTAQGIKEMVADFRYSPGPQTVKEWTDQFVYTKRPCKVTTKFSEYDVNPQTENCYLIFESMHYKVPAEISDQERLNQYKTETSESEINFSRKMGFQF